MNPYNWCRRPGLSQLSRKRLAERGAILAAAAVGGLPSPPYAQEVQDVPLTLTAPVSANDVVAAAEEGHELLARCAADNVMPVLAPVGEACEFVVAGTDPAGQAGDMTIVAEGYVDGKGFVALRRIR